MTSVEDLRRRGDTRRAGAGISIAGTAVARRTIHDGGAFGVGLGAFVSDTDGVPTVAAAALATLAADASDAAITTDVQTNLRCHSASTAFTASAAGLAVASVAACSARLRLDLDVGER